METWTRLFRMSEHMLNKLNMFFQIECQKFKFHKSNARWNVMNATVRMSEIDAR